MSKLSVADHLTRLIERSPKIQREIALEAGYDHPNIISMFKMGNTKVPIEAVPGLAKALDEDPAVLLRLVLFEYSPKALEVIERHLGRLPGRPDKP